jgi:sugar transferase (PEP-CTERM/EpsH1 system associated)
MNGLLFLSHRIPYPPNKGDKIRSYHLLKHLIDRYDVYMGTFVDDPADWRYRESLERMCAGSYFANIDPRWARARSLKGLIGGRPLTLGYYWDGGLKEWVDAALGGGRIQRALVFSSCMAQYVMRYAGGDLHTLVDFVDIDSDKWAQYGDSKAWPASWLYRREARLLSKYEREVAVRFDVSVFVSEAESELFKRRVPEASGRITHIDNGVNADYFSPDRDYPVPYSRQARVVVFTGAMDYWPNVDAVTWFAREVFPQVRSSVQDAWFYIVGARPGQAVKQLSEMPNIRVTGTVEDVRPYVAHADLAVAPLRVARGVQNKVLEAMSMGKPVVATGMALEGIAARAGVRRADSARAFAEEVVNLLNDVAGRRSTVMENRTCILQHYDWSLNLARLNDLIESGLGSRRVA